MHRFEIAEDDSRCRVARRNRLQLNPEFAILVVVDYDLRVVRQGRSQEGILSKPYRLTPREIATPGIELSRNSERGDAKREALSARIFIDDGVASFVIEDRILAIAGANDIDVVACATLQNVVAFAAVQGIVARSADQRVSAIAADQCIVPGIASKRIVVRTAFQVIVSLASGERIFSVAAIQVIGVVPALQGIAPVAGKTDADGIDLLQHVAAHHPDAVVLALGVLDRLVGIEVTLDAVIFAQDRNAVGNVVDVFLVLPGQELGAVTEPFTC